MQLTTFPFFKTLEKEALVFLQDHLKPIKIPKDTLLFYQGDICDNILWLTKGEVRLYTQSDEIEEITLYTLHAGEQCIVNTASLLSQTESIASAQTVTDIEGYLIDVESVKELAKLSDVYQSYLFSLYQLRFSALTTLINDIKFKRLDERILEWLEKRNTKIVETTHEQLANELGSSRVVISRLLKVLESKGNVILHRGKIEFL
ncbi:MAG: Crp/Fnr family transcriptional regulator [Sulfurovum sp.]|nr:MAG: Crp/Fnr family transcriptional regulator [Sulfurovum sp.]